MIDIQGILDIFDKRYFKESIDLIVEFVPDDQINYNLGYCFYRKDSESFILLNESLFNNPIWLVSVLIHELTHLYLYMKGSPSHHNRVFWEKFHEMSLFLMGRIK